MASQFRGLCFNFRLADAHGEADTAAIVRRGLAQAARKGPSDIRNDAIVTRRRAARAAHRRVRPGCAAIV